MRVTIHQPQFLPWLGYLDKIDQADMFIALDSVQFKKNEWQNRNRIRTADGCQWVTVPVLHHFGQLVNDVRINQAVAWRSQHLRAIEMHYARAPFRDRYLPELRSLYEASWERLHELNMAVIRWLRPRGPARPLPDRSTQAVSAALGDAPGRVPGRAPGRPRLAWRPSSVLDPEPVGRGGLVLRVPVGRRLGSPYTGLWPGRRGDMELEGVVQNALARLRDARSGQNVVTAGQPALFTRVLDKTAETPCETGARSREGRRHT